MCLCGVGTVPLRFRHSWQKMIIALIFYSPCLFTHSAHWTFVGWVDWMVAVFSGIGREFCAIWGSLTIWTAWNAPLTAVHLVTLSWTLLLPGGETRQETRLLFFLQHRENAHTKFEHWSTKFYKATTIDSCSTKALSFSPILHFEIVHSDSPYEEISRIESSQLQKEKIGDLHTAQERYDREATARHAVHPIQVHAVQSDVGSKLILFFGRARGFQNGTQSTERAGWEGS